MKKTLVVVAGPTAVGKTSCGISLAQALSTEIISADSRQLYKECRIGTAVPSPEELALVPHHFIQCRPLSAYYNASMFEEEVLERLNQLFRHHNHVLMVGGSGLYIDAVCQGIDELPGVDPELRYELHERLKEEGLDALFSQLQVLDPAICERIDRRNHMRVLKALEVSLQTGRPYSSFLNQPKKARPFDIVRLALDMEREQLYERINRRVDQMMEAGLLKEVKALLHLRHHTAMKTVGYRELFRFLDGKTSLEEAVDQIRRNTRKYARKQLTWFRREDRYTWFHPDDIRAMLRYIGKLSPSASK
ncbi:MAG: tRNA (adenosine(37)-N6)-dimethylallyltransferase MiaA [Bacteroidetes bacterium]|nr:MAG: tRNA (adenosine(37)-N6)-dimethylallyltransferase MiaA [Bacteroidota bacterium]